MEEKQKDQTVDLKVSKHLFSFLVGWAGFQLIALILQVFYIAIFAIFLPNQSLTELADTTGFNMFHNSLCYFITITIIFIIIGVDFKKLFKADNVFVSIVAGVICFVAVLIIEGYYSRFISYLNIDLSDNQNESSIKTIVGDWPILSLIVFGIVGPITEELTYRVGLFSVLKKKSVALAYVVSSIVFALIHFDFTIVTTILFNGSSETLINSLINELLNIPFYLIPALVFGFVYHKFGFVGSITAHITNNLVSIVSIIYVNSLQ